MDFISPLDVIIAFGNKLKELNETTEDLHLSAGLLDDDPDLRALLSTTIGVCNIFQEYGFEGATKEMIEDESFSALLKSAVERYRS